MEILFPGSPDRDFIRGLLCCSPCMWLSARADAPLSSKPYGSAVRMMKLCFVADTNHANAANWLRYFAVELGHDIHAVSLTGVTRDIEGVTLYNLKTSRKLLLLTRIAALRKLVRQIRPDLVIAYRVQSYGFLCACTGFFPLVLVAQ